MPLNIRISSSFFINIPRDSGPNAEVPSGSAATPRLQRRCVTFLPRFVGIGYLELSAAWTNGASLCHPIIRSPQREVDAGRTPTRGVAVAMAPEATTSSPEQCINSSGAARRFDSQQKQFDQPSPLLQQQRNQADTAKGSVSKLAWPIDGFLRLCIPAHTRRRRALPSTHYKKKRSTHGHCLACRWPPSARPARGAHRLNHMMLRDSFGAQFSTNLACAIDAVILFALFDHSLTALGVCL
jgi:hypothetical protein